jgi:predicted RNA polymerase sigma factor
VSAVQSRPCPPFFQPVLTHRVFEFAERLDRYEIPTTADGSSFHLLPPALVSTAEAFALKTLGGLETDAIARAFLL